MKRLTALFLFCIMLLSLFLPVASNAVTESAEARRRFELFDLYLEELSSNLTEIDGEDAAKITRTLKSTRHIAGFDGSYYTLAEYSPCGYIIFHDASGTFAEASLQSNSPYYGRSGAFYYCGPNEYYIEDHKGDIRYAHLDEPIEREAVELLRDMSKNNARYRLENRNELVLDYIAGYNDGLKWEEYAARRLAKSGQEPTRSSGEVKRPELISKLKDPGYFSVNGGVCGYIALGILLGYKTVTKVQYIDWRTHYTYSGNQLLRLKTKLPWDLFKLGKEIGFSNATISWDIYQTMRGWLLRRGFSANNCYWHTVGQASNVRIRGHIDNDRPVIWMGYITSNDYNSQGWMCHAVVIYRYFSSVLGGFSCIAHFGWIDATAVSFTGIVGGLVTMN